MIQEKEVIPSQVLNHILSEHHKWLETKGAEGQQAELKGVNLKEANLRGLNLQCTNLQEANLKGADLQGADLRKANLRKTILHEINLEGANVEKADFRGADLENAKLKDVLGLEVGQLGGANTRDAEIPDGIITYEPQLTEVSKLARTIFASLLLGCLYCWIIITSTTDASLLAKAREPNIPLINTPIDIVGFYLAAPFVLLCIYCYLHLYLERVWESLAGRPAIYPDGRRLDQIEYPWMINGLIRTYSKYLRKNRPFSSYIQNFLTMFLAWWAAPLTILYFWVSYLPRHDLKYGTSYQYLFNHNISGGSTPLSAPMQSYIYQLCEETIPLDGLFEESKFL
jgi:hypothetical protein